MSRTGMFDIEELKEKPGDSLDVRRTKTLLGEMLDLDPTRRPTAKELLDRISRLCSPYTDVWESLLEECK